MDEIELSYPVEVYSHGMGDDVCIRLSTAIRIACIDDGGKACGIDYSDSEVEPFEKLDNVHSFFRIAPTGGLSQAVNMITNVVRVSIEKGKLKTVILRSTFDDTIDINNTWVSALDFESWCTTRRIDLGELWGQYWEQEREILGNGLMEIDKLRMRHETPNFEERLKIVTKEFVGPYSHGPHFDTMDMLEELTAYRSFSKPKMAEKPLFKSERDTLLTIIAALAKEAKIDIIKAPGKSALYIEGLTAGLGAHVSKRAIEEHLKKIPNALETRMK